MKKTKMHGSKTSKTNAETAFRIVIGEITVAVP